MAAAVDWNGASLRLRHKLDVLWQACWILEDHKPQISDTEFFTLDEGFALLFFALT